MIQQITTLQIPQQHDMETIRQSIEDFSLPPFTGSEDLYDSDSDRDNTACHSLYVLRRTINCSSPDVPTTSIVPSTPTVHWSTEIPAAPRWQVRHRTADHDAPKKGLPRSSWRPLIFTSYV